MATKGILQRTALCLAVVAVVSGWIDKVLYQRFIAAEFQHLGYLERNVQIISIDKITKYITTSPGGWVTLCTLASGVAAYYVWRAGLRYRTKAIRERGQTTIHRDKNERRHRSSNP